MSCGSPGRSLRYIKKRILITAAVLGILVLAVGGWTVRGVRRAGGRRRIAPALRPAFASR